MNLQRPVTAKPGMSRPKASIPTQQDFKEYVVRVQRNPDKQYSVMKFNSGDRVDFTKWKKGTMVREDNLGAFKDQASMPKFGEGSEYGRERREEARKKKYGIISKKYKEEDQPWILKQHEKGGKKYKGRKEGGINDNACHYIFTQNADGSFCASPVKSWYKFTPMVQYKYLNDEEAEEEFGRRDKTLNFFSVMVKRRLKQDGSEDSEQKEEKSKASRKKDSLQITEEDDYLGFLTDDDSDDDSDDDAESRAAKEKKAKKKAKKTKKRNRVKKKEWGEEAVEESDVDDYDDQEKDYLSEKSSDEEETIERRKDEERGLDEEIEEINLSSEEEVEEEVKEPDADETENKEKDEKTKEDGSSPSGSESDDSDIDDSKIQSAVFMQNKTQSQPKKSSGKSSKSSSRNSSRPGTPSTGDNTSATLSGVAGRLQEKVLTNKRPGDGGSSSSSQSHTPGPPAKKSRTESPTPFKGQPGEVRITEDVVRRYLMRKPMTTKDLLHKLNPKRTGMSPSDIVARLTEVMFKLNPQKEVIKDKVYWSIKST